jgi:predicted porin
MCAALLLSATSVAYADDVSDIKKQQEQLLKQNQALIKKLAEVEKRQKQLEAKAKAEGKLVAQAPAGQGAPGTPGAQWTAADLTRRLLNPNDDTTLTFYGITIYGALDVGGTYQTHGSPLSPTFAPGLSNVIQKMSNKSIFSAIPNNLSDSSIGIKGTEEFAPGWSAVFNVQTAFDPTSGQIEDGRKTLVVNNGVSLVNQTTNGDSSKDGQAFINAYGGVSSPVYGTMTFGRQNSLGLDGVKLYDPMGASQTFSPIGFSGVAAGLGDTDSARLDNAVKYRVNAGPARAAALYTFGPSGYENANSYQGQLGFDYQGFSFDGIGSHISNAVNGGSLSAVNAAGLLPAQLAQPGNGIINGTVSDNTSFMLLAKYTTGAFKFFGGYENIHYANPRYSMYTGETIVGGYVLDVASEGYNGHVGYNGRVLQVFWTGVKYAVNSNLELTGAYYHFDQNNFTASAGVVVNCGAAVYNGLIGATANSGACHGSENVVSALVDYHFTKRFDVFGGVSWNDVNGGMASGFASAGKETAGEFQPTVGTRFQF